MTLKRPWMVAAGVTGGILTGFLVGTFIVRSQSPSDDSEVIASDTDEHNGSAATHDPVVEPSESGSDLPASPPGPANLSEDRAAFTRVPATAALTSRDLESQNELSKVEPLRRGLLRADREIAEGNIAAAIGTCHTLLKTDDRLLHDRLQARLGICYEALGQHDKALKHFRDLSTRAATPHGRHFALVSQARIWSAAGRQRTAIPLLCGFLRMTDTTSQRPSPVLVAEANQLLGCTLADLARANTRQDVLDDRTALIPPLSRAPKNLVAQLDAVPSAATTAPLEADTETIQLRSQFGSGVDGVILDAVEQGGSLAAFLTKLADTAGFTIIGSKSARQALTGRTATLALRDQPLANILDLLLLPLELNWHENGTTIEIQTAQELTADERSAYLAATAARTLRGTVTQSPEHDLAAHALIRLAVLTSDAGDRTQAASFYSQLIREYPRSAILPWAWFNRAKIELLAGEFDEAKKSFFQIIDGSPGHRLAATSRLYVGRLFLELDDPESAIRPLIRATTQASQRSVQSESALLLASAYLITGKPYPASMVLQDYREPLSDDRTVDRAAFLSALTRYRTTQEGPRKNEEGRNLVAALTQIQLDELFGAAMLPLIGSAYQQLQLHGQMAALYREAVPQVTSPSIRDRLHRELGAWYRRTGQLSEATEQFRALTDSQDETAQRFGRRKLAEIAFDLKLDNDCLRTCRELLDVARDDKEKLSVLELMGRVYERQGDYSRAAMCFAGLLPDNKAVNLTTNPANQAAASKEPTRE